MKVTLEQREIAAAITLYLAFKGRLAEDGINIISIRGGGVRAEIFNTKPISISEKKALEIFNSVRLDKY